MVDVDATANGSKPHTNGTVPVMGNGSGSSYAAKHNIADHFIGGNKLENAPASKVKDFVAHNDGHTVITNVSFYISSPCLNSPLQPHHGR